MVTNLDQIEEHKSTGSDAHIAKNSNFKTNKNKVMLLTEGVSMSPTSEITCIKEAPPKSKIQIEDYWKRRRDDQAKLVDQHDKIVQRKQICR